MEFQKGEVVTLRSGGGPMTVRAIGKKSFGREIVWCVWMVKGKKNEAAFDAEVLKKSSVATAAVR
jgi:uncharacterized protein YodC (DUF2158 family)